MASSEKKNLTVQCSHTRTVFVVSASVSGAPPPAPCAGRLHCDLASSARLSLGVLLRCTDPFSHADDPPSQHVSWTGLPRPRGSRPGLSRQVPWSGVSPCPRTPLLQHGLSTPSHGEDQSPDPKSSVSVDGSGPLHFHIKI